MIKHFEAQKWFNEQSKYKRVFKRISKIDKTDVYYEARLIINGYHNPVRFVNRSLTKTVKELDLYLLQNGKEQLNNSWKKT
jgi:hypothetical protein